MWDISEPEVCPHPPRLLYSPISSCVFVQKRPRPDINIIKLMWNDPRGCKLKVTLCILINRINKGQEIRAGSSTRSRFKPDPGELCCFSDEHQCEAGLQHEARVGPDQCKHQGCSCCRLGLKTMAFTPQLIHLIRK